MCWQVADTLEKRSTVVKILTEAVRAYQAADVMETQGEVYLKNLNSLSDTLHDLKNRHEGTPGSLHHHASCDAPHGPLTMKVHLLMTQTPMHRHAPCDAAHGPLLCMAVHGCGLP